MSASGLYKYSTCNKRQLQGTSALSGRRPLVLILSCCLVRLAAFFQVLIEIENFKRYATHCQNFDKFYWNFLYILQNFKLNYSDYAQLGHISFKLHRGSSFELTTFHKKISKYVWDTRKARIICRSAN